MAQSGKQPWKRPVVRPPGSGRREAGYMEKVENLMVRLGRGRSSRRRLFAAELRFST